INDYQQTSPERPFHIHYEVASKEAVQSPASNKMSLTFRCQPKESCIPTTFIAVTPEIFGIDYVAHC
ncbi:hypothetical protein, partial [Demequina sp.]|uniref:hypothetical protein n=1 Tax=Demequina sp. TaxID=2050685 RepID=UPI003A8A81BC